jgi:hypothetical protein
MPAPLNSSLDNLEEFVTVSPLFWTNQNLGGQHTRTSLRIRSRIVL